MEEKIKIAWSFPFVLARPSILTAKIVLVLARFLSVFGARLGDVRFGLGPLKMTRVAPYRLGSLGKSFTALTWLAFRCHLSDLV